MTLTLLPLLVSLSLQSPSPLTIIGEINKKQVQAEDITVQPQSKLNTKVLGLTIAGILGGVDLSRSMYEFGKGRAYELNPFLRYAQDRPELFAVIKGSIDSVVILTLAKNKDHKYATLFIWSYVALRTAVVIHNYRTAVKFTVVK